MYLSSNSANLKTTSLQQSLPPPYISEPISDDFTATSHPEAANRLRPDCSVTVAVMLWNPQIVCGKRKKRKRFREN